MGGALRGALRNLEYVKKESWRSVTVKHTTLQKVKLHHGCFSRFLNCTYGTKSRKVLHSWRSVQDRCNPMRYVHTLNKVVLLVEILI